MNSTKLKQYLSQNHLFPKKSLSQNFLIDNNIRDKILGASNLAKGDVVVEIGPGPGILTEALLQYGVFVIAIEKDRHFAKSLQEKNYKNLLVFAEDFLSFPLKETLLSYCGEKKAKIVANIPYQITSPIITKVLPLYDVISSVTLMVQHEIAERITAKEGSKKYGRLSIFAKLYSNPSYIFKVSPSCFYPRPKVYSAILQMVLHQPPQEIGENQHCESFESFVKLAFQNRRKTLVNCLKGRFPLDNLKIALTKILKPLDIRPEKLSLEEFIALFSLLQEH